MDKCSPCNAKRIDILVKITIGENEIKKARACTWSKTELLMHRHNIIKLIPFKGH